MTTRPLTPDDVPADLDWQQVFGWVSRAPEPGQPPQAQRFRRCPWLVIDADSYFDEEAGGPTFAADVYDERDGRQFSVAVTYHAPDMALLDAEAD